MIKNLKIISLLIYTFALTSLACVKKDGVVFISDDLDIESPIFDAVKKSEVLAKRQEWREAALILKDIIKRSENEVLKCGEDIELVLGYTYASYIFNARRDDPCLPKITNELIGKYSDCDFKTFCADLHRLLMAYYWSIQDVKSHDNVLRRLVLYDKNPDSAFVDLLYASLERDSCRACMKDFLVNFNGKTGDLYDLAFLFYSELSDKAIKDGIIKWLEQNIDARGFVMRCFVAHAASILSCDDLDFVSNYCSKLNEWLMQQEDSKDRKDIVTFVLSERYRIAAILDVSLK